MAVRGMIYCHFLGDLVRGTHEFFRNRCFNLLWDCMRFLAFVQDWIMGGFPFLSLLFLWEGEVGASGVLKRFFLCRIKDFLWSQYNFYSVCVWNGFDVLILFLTNSLWGIQIQCLIRYPCLINFRLAFSLYNTVTFGNNIWTSWFISSP